MATLTVRGLDEEVRHRLRQRAAANDRSMEAEARAILAAAVSDQDGSTEVALDAAHPVARILSPREERVAGLVAAGLTNRQIADVLYLSERTVESHVSSILRKLGCARRATVASWVTAHPPGGDT